MVKRVAYNSSGFSLFQQIACQLELFMTNVYRKSENIKHSSKILFVFKLKNYYKAMGKRAEWRLLPGFDRKRKFRPPERLFVKCFSRYIDRIAWHDPDPCRTRLDSRPVAGGYPGRL
jgi:hypothetical protein